MATFKKITMKEQVYHLIKERILDQTYGFGEKINMLELSQELGISSSPISEALSVLESERLVTFTPNAGPSVIKIDNEIFEEAKQTAIILLLGSYNQCVAQDRIPSLITEMEASLAYQKSLIQDTSSDSHNKFARASIEFDFSMIKVLENKTLDGLYQWFFSTLLLIVLYNHQQYNTDRSKNVAEHENILKAIKSGNYDEVKKHYYMHFSRYLDSE